MQTDVSSLVKYGSFQRLHTELVYSRVCFRYKFSKKWTLSVVSFGLCLASYLPHICVIYLQDGMWELPGDVAWMLPTTDRSVSGLQKCSFLAVWPSDVNKHDEATVSSPSSDCLKAVICSEEISSSFPWPHHWNTSCCTHGVSQTPQWSH